MTELFSQRHPGAYGMSRALLPRLHVLAFVCAIVYWLEPIRELAKHYTMIMIDNPEAINDWLAANWLPLVILGAAAAIIIYVVYSVVWRWLFPDYHLVITDESGTDIGTIPNGRLYWSTEVLWFGIWDSIYHRGEDVERPLEVWVNERGLLNLFNPPRSLNRVVLHEDESLERDSFQRILAHERPYRVRRGIRRYETMRERESTVEAPWREADQDYKARVKSIIGDTRELVKANPAVRADQVIRGAFPLSDDVRLEVYREQERVRRVNEATETEGDRGDID